MTEAQMLSKAIAIVSSEFEHDMDKGGSPYVLHCLAVMEGVRHLGFVAMTVAVLHDLFEDKDWNIEKLVSAGFSEEIAKMVDMLTHKKDEDYLTYVGRASQTEITKAVKMSDLKHNMDPARLVDLSDKSMQRIRKYHTAYQFLMKVKN